MQRKQLQTLSFIALLALMLLLMGRIFLPFSSVLLWSAVFYILFSPLYSKIVRRMDKNKKLYEIKRHLLAGSFSLVTVLLMVGIFLFLGFQLIGQGRIFLEEAKLFVEGNPLFFSSTGTGAGISTLVKNISLGTVDLSSLDLKSETIKFLSAYSETIVGWTRVLLKNVSSFLVSLAFMSFSLYFRGQK